MTQTGVRSSRQRPQPAHRFGAWLLWFAVLGGIVAWSVHLIFAWGAVEVACTSVTKTAATEISILNLSLRGFAVLATAVPLAVAVVSLAAAWRFRVRQLSRERGEPEGEPDEGASRLDRARFMVELGLGLNVLAVLMIAFGGVAVLWFAPCTL